MRRLLAIATLLMLVMPSTLLAQDDPDLKAAPIAFRMKEGLTLRYAVENRIATTTTLVDGGNESSAAQSQLSVVRITFGHVNQERGLAAATFTTESFRMTLSSPESDEIVIDSNDPNVVEKYPDAQLMLAMIGVPIDFVMEQTGRVIAANGQAVRELVLAKLGGPDSNQEVHSLVDVALSDQALKDSIALVLGTVPGRTTTVGEIWSTRFSLPAPALGRLEFLVESMLSKLEYQGNERIALIDSTMIIIDRPPAGGSQGRILDPLDHKGSGMVQFDTTRGVLLSSSSEIKFKMELNTLDQLNQERTTHTVAESVRSVRLLPGER